MVKIILQCLMGRMLMILYLEGKVKEREDGLKEGQ